MKQSGSMRGRTIIDAGELSPKAAKLLNAASRVLLRDGFSALSLDAVGEEAGEYRGSVPYYFKNKAGLVEALVRLSLTEPHLEENLAKLRQTPPGRGRLVEHLELWRHNASNLDESRVFLELLPYITRDPLLRAEALALYESWRETDASLLNGEMGHSEGDLEAVATIIGAVVDGLQVLRLIDEQHDHSEKVLGVLADMIDSYLWTQRQPAESGA